MVTTKPSWKIKSNSLWVLLSSNLIYVSHVLNFAKTLEGEIERLMEMAAAIGP